MKQLSVLLKAVLLPALFALLTAAGLHAQTSQVNFSAAPGQEATVKLRGEYLNSSYEFTSFQSGEFISNNYTNIYLYAEPAEGYMIEKWTLNDEEINLADGTLTFAQKNYSSSLKTSSPAILNFVCHTKKIEGEQLYQVQFGARYTSKSRLYFTATADGKPIQSGAMLPAGTKVLITPHLQPGCTFTKWSVSSYEDKNHGKQQYTEEADHVISIESLSTDVLAEATATGEPTGVKVPINFEVAAGKGELNAVDAKTNEVITTGLVIQKGTEIQFTATPAEGYVIDKWENNGAQIKDYWLEEEGTKFKLILGGEETTIKVYFKNAAAEVKNYKVEYAVAPGQEELGGISVGLNGNPEDGFESGAELPEGTAFTFYMFPEKGYLFDKLTINDVDVSADVEVNSAGALYRVVALDKNLSAVVSYKEKPAQETTYELTFEAGDGGTLSAKDADGTAISSGALINEGAEITFTAIPNDKFEVKEWVVNNETTASKETSKKIKITQKTTVKVVFQQVGSVAHVAPAQLNAYIAADRLVVTGLTKATAVHMYSITGQEVRAQATLNGFGVSDLANGIYLVKVGKSVFKVVKR